jgi:hypothetical protein
MLTAAADFLRAAEAFRKAVRNARSDLNEDTYNGVRDRVDDLYPTVTLVSLLYGYASKPSLRAVGVGSSAIDVRDELVKGSRGDVDDSVVESAMNDLGEHLIVFGEAAADQVRRGGLRRRLRPLSPNVPAIPTDW